MPGPLGELQIKQYKTELCERVSAAIFFLFSVFSSDGCEDTEIINYLSVPTMERPLWMCWR